MAITTSLLLSTQFLSIQNNPKDVLPINYFYRNVCLSIQVSKLPSTPSTNRDFTLKQHTKMWPPPDRNADSITYLCREGRLEEALAKFQNINSQDDNSELYASILDACGNAKAIEVGKQIHAHILLNGLHDDLLLNNKLLSMYSMCGSLRDACIVFEQVEDPNNFVWNAMIRACVRNGNFEEALLLYCKMQQAGKEIADKFTFTYVLKACASLRALDQGKEIHNRIIRGRIEIDEYLENALLAMYAKCGSLQFARQVFDKMPKRNLISWNALIVGCARGGLGDEALNLFFQMQLAGTRPDSVTTAVILGVCSNVGALLFAKQIHGQIAKSEFDSDVFVGSALIDMYSDFQSVACARHVFDGMCERDAVLWNAMIAGYVRNGEANEALELFSKMQLVGLKPDSFTFVSVVQACSSLVCLQQGRMIHGLIFKSGFVSNSFVGSALVIMYGKCGNVKDAHLVFDEMSERDMGLWNAMIAAYAENEQAIEAFRYFRQMQLVGLKADLITITSVLPACAPLGAMQQGKEIHQHIIKYRIENVFVMSGLIDMYAKCGNVKMARRVFDKMQQRDVVAWNAMIACYGMHGHGKDALKLFYEMHQEGFKPVYTTLISLLSACSHAGLVNEGRKCFDEMTEVYHIQPGPEHYSCMVDLLGRASKLNEAHEFIKTMPIKPDAGVWGALLGACRIHCNVELGEHIAERLFELEAEMAGYYVLLSNIYAVAGRWNGVAKVRKMIKDRGVKKNPGKSWIIVGNRIHEFVAADKSHPQSENIYAALENLTERMEEAGYVPDKNFVLEDADDNEKEHFLHGHSERIAISFGIISTYPRSPIQITKNLRVCGDCHNATKLISKITKREIIVRDANRFHCFKDGVCSCSDYW